MSNAKRPTLGQLMRRLRARQNLTVKEMSAKAGIPVSTLSKIEHDRLTLSYDKILQLSERLGIGIAELFAGEEQATESTPSARRSIGRMGDALRVNTQNYDYNYLCTDLRQKRMIPIVVKIRAKTVEEFGELVRHAGEEFIYVLEGPVEVHTEVYSPVTLQRGESIYIDSGMGHAYLAADGCDEAVVLGVCSGSAEDLMSELMEIHDLEGI